MINNTSISHGTYINYSTNTVTHPDTLVMKLLKADCMMTMLDRHTHAYTTALGYTLVPESQRHNTGRLGSELREEE